MGSLAIDDGDRFWLTVESPADGGTLVAAAIPLPGEVRLFEPGTAHHRN